LPQEEEEEEEEEVKIYQKIFPEEEVLFLSLLLL
jgi:hypothetical protein